LIPGRHQPLLRIRVEDYFCGWPGSVGPDEQWFPIQSHIRPRPAKLFPDVAYRFPPPLAKAAEQFPSIVIMSCSAARPCAQTQPVLQTTVTPGRAPGSIGGSPRTARAWPLAWPSPSGPLGWQRSPGSTARRRRVPRSGMRSTVEAGGASPDNARRPGPLAVTSSRFSAHLARALRPGRGAGGRGSGIRRGPQAAGHRECRARQPPRRRACVRRTRRKLPPRNGETPGLNPGRLRRVTLAAHSLSTARARPRFSRPGPSGPARRRCALEDVKKVLTNRTTSVVDVLRREVSSGQAAIAGRWWRPGVRQHMFTAPPDALHRAPRPTISQVVRSRPLASLRWRRW
jgi:hypothetical protein